MSCLTEEFNSTEPSPPVSVPCSDNLYCSDEDIFILANIKLFKLGSIRLERDSRQSPYRSGKISSRLGHRFSGNREKVPFKPPARSGQERSWTIFQRYFLKPLNGLVVERNGPKKWRYRNYKIAKSLSYFKNDIFTSWCDPILWSLNIHFVYIHSMLVQCRHQWFVFLASEKLYFYLRISLYNQLLGPYPQHFFSS